jgi:hypothetical protein
VANCSHEAAVCMIVWTGEEELGFENPLRVWLLGKGVGRVCDGECACGCWSGEVMAC